MHKIALIGATGSVGSAVLRVIETYPQVFSLYSAAAYRNVEKLISICKKFNAKNAYLYESKKYDMDKDDIFGINLKTGSETLEEMVCDPNIDKVIFASSGVASLKALILALKSGKDVLIANKESLIVGGKWIKESIRYDNQLLPLDSEHNAIWLCLGKSCRPSDVRRMFITASGGPFLNYPLEALSEVKPKEALKHPVWQMGNKITIDSATMMNKGLEIIEASILFNMPIDRIEGFIHPESRIHGGVEFIDGSVCLAAFYPDMFLPTLYALSYPQRLNVPAVERPLELGTLNLKQIDEKRYPCYFVAIEAARMGGAYPALLVGADEEAVNLYIKELIAFTEIPGLIRKALDSYKGEEPQTLEDAVELVNIGRTLVKEQFKKYL